jgi:hypothetical protein
VGARFQRLSQSRPSEAEGLCTCVENPVGVFRHPVEVICTLRPVRFGAAAGAVGVVLFLAGALLVGERPGFDAGGAELLSYVRDHRTAIQVACALFAVAVPLLVWFLAAVGSRVAFGGGIVFLSLFLADCTALAVSALRPDPDLVVPLRDFELLAMGLAAPAAAAMLVALGASGVWSRWLSRLAFLAAALYLLRTGTLFTTDGPFAADGLLGLRIPVVAIAAWWLAASLFLLVSGPCSSARQSPAPS